MDGETKNETADNAVSSTEDRDLTYGEKAVGLRFNPGGDETVNDLKKLYATIIDGLNDHREGAESPEAKRLYSIAITEAQTAQMWAVKAVTWSE